MQNRKHLFKRPEMKILIVDDERAIRNSLKEILGDEGYEVDTAENGAAALAMVDKEKYNVIFCDIKMPEMDGTEVLDKLVADGRMLRIDGEPYVTYRLP